MKWNAVSNDEAKLIMDHLDSAPKEEGFPCGHRGLCLYILPWLDDNGCEVKPTWRKIHREYLAFVGSKNGITGSKDRALPYQTWRDWVSHAMPTLHTSRTMTDLCNTCERLKVELKQCNPESREYEERLECLTVHRRDASEQRRAMNSAIKLALLQLGEMEGLSL